MLSQFFGVIKYLLVLLLLALICYGSLAYSHESDEYKHGSAPQCYGWEKMGSNIRKCFLGPEHKKCVNLIYNHGQWHVTKPYKCDEEE